MIGAQSTGALATPRLLRGCDCLNHCGDDPGVLNGQARKCAALLASEKRTRDTEILCWRDVPGDELPDAELVVLVELDGDNEPVWPGYWTGACWHTVAGGPFAGQVTGWTEMPAGRSGR